MSGSSRVFGQAMQKSSSRSAYRRQMGTSGATSDSASNSNSNSNKAAQRRRQIEATDAKFGYERFTLTSHGLNGATSKRGWIFNMAQTTLRDESKSSGSSSALSALDIYMLAQNGDTFKCTVVHNPYFYVVPSSSISSTNEMSSLVELSGILMRKYSQTYSLLKVEIVEKEDLDLVNHLSGKKRSLLKLVFAHEDDMMACRAELRPIITKNKSSEGDKNLTDLLHRVNKQVSASDLTSSQSGMASNSDPLQNLVDMREYDVPYVVRVCIDLDIRAGCWYTATPHTPDSGGVLGSVVLSDKDFTNKADPSYLAFDIECTKAPLKFPNAEVDEIYMISYMVNGQGYLITSRSIVSEDVPDFEYTPKPNFPGPFMIFNESNEKALIQRFFSHFLEVKPQIVITYNGDFFDWPFLETRAQLYGLSIEKDLGVERVGEEYRGRCCVHLDAFSWVKRDSYLPQGAQGLKAVTKYKLGYDPVEVDPEDMVRFASERPVHMATYSVSDAVATYYLYEKYVHLFIFSLCTIIPMGPEDVLRKGSGTLCEALLMVEAFNGNILCPNKQNSDLTKFHNGHLLEAETYIGGHVECLETGVYRSDVNYTFDVKPDALNELIKNIDRDLAFAIEVEAGMDRFNVKNYDEIRHSIVQALEHLRDNPHQNTTPYIYHLDVGAMYPNIILTNRLQPDSIVDKTACAGCVYNRQESGCKREMEWIWRGDYSPSNKAEYERVKAQMISETIDGVPFHSLDEKEQTSAISTRLKQYSRTAYKRTKITQEESRKNTVCMRENPFYVETVRLFRDRRYEYKQLTKKWKKECSKAEKSGDAVATKFAEDQSLVYDSLQVAHKCILNSFYGYVMRKGARWRSMEMAGIVTLTGANIIKQARELVEQIGRPLELDTDGIWCILPSCFPDKYTLYTHDNVPITVEYPCAMLNAAVHNNFSNHQYQQYNEAIGKYQTRSECSIFFEVDGPYRCMVLPASLEENVLLKKRYAVFNFDGSLAELKGFELKRRGELELIKAFQSQVFERFLDGESLQDCYDSVAEIANHWLDVLDTQGMDLDTDELFDLISENRSMSRQLEDYGDQKGTSQTTARRLGEFLGNEIIKDKGLNCKFVIAERPYGRPVTERAIPTAIWKAETSVMKHYLRKWLKSPELDDFDVRGILDWDYYKDRLSKTIQKIITIPAGLQGVMNPVPRVPHPQWLGRRVRGLLEGKKQLKMSEIFASKKKVNSNETGNASMSSPILDIEDFGRNDSLSLISPSTSPQKDVLSQPDISAPSKTRVVTPPRVSLTSTTFFPWLEQRKRTWRNQRSSGKAKSRTISSSASKGSLSIGDKRRKLANVQSYLRHQLDTIHNSELHIIEVRQSDVPGQFLLWCIVSNGSVLHKLTLNVPRVVYANSTEELFLDQSLRKVKRHLPHGVPFQHLYEVTLKESTFMKQNENALGGRVRETYFETKQPLWYQALSNLSCCTRLKNTEEGNTSKYSIENMQPIKKPASSYLSMISKHLYLYESTHRQGLGIISLFISDRTVGSAEGFIWIVGGSIDGVSTKHCRTLYSNIVSQLQEAKLAEYADITPLILKSCSRVAKLSQAHELLNQQLIQYLQAKPGPSFLLHNIHTPIELMYKHIPSIAQLPLCALKSSQTLSLGVNWQQRCLDECFQHYLGAMFVSLPNLISMSKYSGIPIGNLGEDPLQRVCDVQFLQLLRNNKCISWASLEPVPDLGTGNDSLVTVEDGNEAYVLRNKGVYRSICVELDVKKLLIAAMCRTDDTITIVNPLAISNATNGVGGSLGDEMSCTTAVAVLRQLLHQYIRDSSSSDNTTPADILDQLYRIISSPDTLLYDPTLHRCLHKMMRDIFLQLMASLQMLGCSVIYGCFSRIVVCTHKYNLHAAKEHIDFILSTMQQQENIQHLEIVPNRVWTHYIFMDEYNFGGVEYQSRDEDDILDDEFGKPFITLMGGTQFVPTIVGNWNVKEYLTSDVARAYFQTIVGRFSREAFRRQYKLLEENDHSVDKEELISTQVFEYVKRQISGPFASDLTRMLSELIREGGDSNSFPLLPGSHLHLTNPALEFAKTIISILELDNEVQLEVQILRRSVLTQLGIREYSQSAVFQNPCAEFMLTDLFCGECVETRDLNLCIGGVYPEESHDGMETAIRRIEWCCDECNVPYDSSEIEWRLLDLIQRESVQFQLQDLRCTKTNAVARGYLMKQSECSAPWKADIRKESFNQRLKILRNLAKFHELECLLETCIGLLEIFPDNF